MGRARRPRAVAAATLAFLLVGVPVAGAQGEDEENPLLYRCDKPPAEVVLGLLRLTPAFVMAALTQSERALGKAKCTAFEAAMICSEERIAGSPGTPTTTGSAHPHQDLCYEHGLAGCPAQTKLRHRRENAGGSFRDVHACVPLDDGTPWPL